MRKLVFVGRMLREMWGLVREQRLWFLAPVLLTLVLLSLLVYQVGPTVVITFIYAGV